MLLRKDFSFESAHRLAFHNKTPEENIEIFGKCARLHGHTYKLSVYVRGTKLTNGMLVNFTDLKRVVNKHIIDECDHQFLNNVPMFENKLTTAEEMIKVIAERLHYAFSKEKSFKNVQLHKLVLWETESSCAVWVRDYDTKKKDKD